MKIKKIIIEGVDEFLGKRFLKCIVEARMACRKNEKVLNNLLQFFKVSLDSSAS